MTTTREIEEQSGRFMQVAERLPTLFAIEDRMLRLADAFETAEEERTDEQRTELALLEEMLAQKLEGYCEVIECFQSFYDTRKAEADRLAQRAKSHAATVERLKRRLSEHMAFTGRTRIETARWTLSLRTYPHVEVTDASAVPGEYQRTKIEVSVDKQGIMRDFRNTGAIPPGVEVVKEQKVVLS